MNEELAAQDYMKNNQARWNEMVAIEETEFGSANVFFEGYKEVALISPLQHQTTGSYNIMRWLLQRPYKATSIF
jgi:hypothetical protein